MIVKSNGSFAALILNIVSVAGACLCYAGCGEGSGAHCWIRSENMIGRVSSLSRHISGVHRDTRTQFPVAGQCHTSTSKLTDIIDNPSL